MTTPIPSAGRLGARPLDAPSKWTAGPLGTLNTAWFRVLSPLYRRAVVVERDLGEPIPDVLSSVALRFGPLEPSAREAYLEFQPEARGYAGRRFADGDECFAAWTGERLASTTWCSRGEKFIPYLGHTWRVGAGEVLIFDSYTPPELRGRGISATLGTWMYRHFRDLGVRRIVGAINPRNRASLRLHAKLGFRPRGLVRSVRVGRGRAGFRVWFELPPRVAP
jgi:RimJ/RimL family protein N-acetyltransferase